jgi:hypothetical protein
MNDYWHFKEGLQLEDNPPTTVHNDNNSEHVH